MKKLLVIVCIACFSFMGRSLAGNPEKDSEQVVLENETMKVTEFISSPGEDACGTGFHSHKERLVIAITDASIKLTTQDGKSQNLDLKSGTAFWGSTEMHSVINTGKRPARFYAVEIKHEKQ